MSTTGAVYRQPAANPAGSSLGRARAEVGEVVAPVRRRERRARAASIPETSRTPVRGSAARVRNTSRVWKAQPRARSVHSTRYGLQVAPAAKEVVALPVPAERILIE